MISSLLLDVKQTDGMEFNYNLLLSPKTTNEGQSKKI